MDPATLDMVGVRSSGKIADAGADALAADARTQARRAWRARRRCVRASGVPFPGTSPPPSSSPPRGGAAAARPTKLSRRYSRGNRGRCAWTSRADPSRPRQASPGRTYDDDDGDVGAGDEDGDGDEFSGAEPRRHPWRPLVTHVRVPRLPKDALVEVQPILLDRDGPGVPAPDRDDASELRLGLGRDRGRGTAGGRGREQIGPGVRGASRCTAPVGSVARTSPSHRVKWTRCPWGGRFRRYRLR